LNNKNTIFWRGNLQNDNFAGGAGSATQPCTPQFPGDPPNCVYLNNSKGFATGLTTILSPALVSTFRYGYTREGVQNTGVVNSPYVLLNSIDNLYGTSTGTAQIIPVHDFHEDLVFTKGAHTLSFGFEALLIHNHYSTDSNSFSVALEDGLYLEGDGGPLLPPDAQRSLSTIDVLDTLLGIETKRQTKANYDLQGNLLPQGAIVNRIFKEQHYDMYFQDSWKVARGLTISAGLRLGLNPAITEIQGYNVSPVESIANFYDKRIFLNTIGQSQNLAGLVSYDLSKKTGRGLYPFQTDWAPRFAIAYSPQGDGPMSRFFFGGPDKTSIRAGFGIFYDAFAPGPGARLRQHRWFLDADPKRTR
jgi:hypothetical protein